MSINRNNTSETPKKAALYVRVSTNYQIDRDSLPMQRQELITYAQLMFGINDYVVFEDAGYSGKNTDRPEFQNMMRRIRAGEFTHLLCWKIDRISRNLLDFASMYQELKDLGVTFVSKNEQFDTSTAIGEGFKDFLHQPGGGFSCAQDVRPLFRTSFTGNGIQDFE